MEAGGRRREKEQLVFFGLGGYWRCSGFEVFCGYFVEVWEVLLGLLGGLLW